MNDLNISLITDLKLIYVTIMHTLVWYEVEGDFSKVVFLKAINL